MLSQTDNSFPEKITIFLLAVIGLPLNTNKCVQYLLALFFNCVVFHSIVKLNMCIFSMPSLDYAIFWTIVLDVLNIIQWWCLFLKRKRIHRLSIFLSNASTLKKQYYSNMCIMSLICCIILFPFVMYISYSVKIMFSKVIPYSKCSLWVILGPNFNTIFTFTLNMLKYYDGSAEIHIISFLYDYFCYLILRYQLKLTKVIVEKDPLQAWKQCQKIVHVIGKLEKVMSSLVFITIVKISIFMFTYIKVVSERKEVGIGMFGLYFHAFTIVGWFLGISFSADALQKTCHSNLCLVFMYRDLLKGKGLNINYFTYTKMVEQSSLTGWKIFSINRNLLLTYFASLVTYGVIIYQI